MIRKGYILMNSFRKNTILLSIALAVMLPMAGLTMAAEHLGNAQRTGYVNTQVKTPLHVQWVL